MARSIRGKFGEYYLVCLLSGRWSAVWHAFKETEAFQAILREDQGWFDNQIAYGRPDVYDTRAQALQEIISSLRDAANTRNDGLKDYYVLEIKKAQRALDIALRAEVAAISNAAKSIDNDTKIKQLEAQVAMLAKAAKQVLADIDDDGVAERHGMGVQALRKAVELGPADEFQSVIACARRVQAKFGANSDWSEWRDLAAALNDFETWPLRP